MHLSGKARQDLSNMLKDVEFVIIDEISMVTVDTVYLYNENRVSFLNNISITG